MKNLKGLYDAAKAAEEKVQGIMRDMMAALETGTEEGKQAALEMRVTLDEAKKEADEANQLYITARDAEPGEDPDANARKFVPVPGAAPANQAKQMTRAEFEKLNAGDRMSFMLADGKIIDDDPQS